MRLESEIYLGSPPVDRREAPRTGVDVLARAHVFEKRPLTVNIRDLTTGGFLMEAPIEVDIGATIYLQLPGLHLTAAQVIWKSAHYTGCQFVNPLSGSELSCVEGSAWRI
ncbi:MAG: hypothetical protein AAGE05_11775 [Pseudomonadota bacterium]